MAPFQLIKKVMPPLSAHQKSHDPPPYSTGSPPVEIMNGPLFYFFFASYCNFSSNFTRQTTTIFWIMRDGSLFNILFGII